MPDVMQSLKNAGESFRDGAYQDAVKAIEGVWASLPEDKTAIPNAYLVVEYAVAAYLKLGNLEAAWHWACLGPQFNTKRQNLGESEFLLGKVAYERGDLEIAKKFLSEASEKSKGKILHGENPKYKKLISKKQDG